MVEAASLQRVVNFARPVGGDDDDRQLLGLDRAEFRNGDLKIGQDFEKKSLKRFVGPVQFVDQEDRRRAVLVDGLKQWTLDQKALGKNVALHRFAVGFAAGLT